MEKDVVGRSPSVDDVGCSDQVSAGRHSAELPVCCLECQWFPWRRFALKLEYCCNIVGISQQWLVAFRLENVYALHVLQ